MTMLVRASPATRAPAAVPPRRLAPPARPPRAVLDEGVAVAQELAQEQRRRTPWFEQACEGWLEVKDLAGLSLARNSGVATGRPVVVELLSGACAACRGAYHGVCSLAQDDRLRGNFSFYKANVDEEGLGWWLERNEITTLPHLAVWAPNGTHLVGLVSSRKRLPAVRAALHTILDNPECSRFEIDSDGTLRPVMLPQEVS